MAAPDEPPAAETNPVDAVRDLVTAEQARVSAPDAAKDAIRSELAALFGPAPVPGSSPSAAPSPPAPPAPSALGLPRLFTRAQVAVTGAGLFGLGIAVGVYSATPPRPTEFTPRLPVTTIDAGPSTTRAPDAAVSVIAASELPSAPASRSPASPTAPSPVTPSAPSPSPSSSPSAAAAPATGPGIPSTEDAWIDTAREALSRGLAADCLRAADEHARRYPNGALVEEREALAIQALAALGRRREAGNRAGEFRKRWPESLHLPAVDRSLR